MFATLFETTASAALLLFSAVRAALLMPFRLKGRSGCFVPTNDVASLVPFYMRDFSSLGAAFFARASPAEFAAPADTACAFAPGAGAAWRKNRGKARSLRWSAVCYGKAADIV